MRPTEILLECGLRLASTPSGAWYSHNVPVEPTGLRDLVSSIGSMLCSEEYYQAERGFTCTYAIIDEILKQHDREFAWEVYPPDHSAITLLDELDDICCESRCWFVGGSPKSKVYVPERSEWCRVPATGMEHQHAIAGLTMLAHAHNLRIGSSRLPQPNTSGPIPLAPFSARIVFDAGDAFWLFTDARGSSFMHCKVSTPHGNHCVETEQLVNYMCELSGTLVERGLPPAILG